MSYYRPEKLDMFIESNRLETFKDWPNPNMTPQSLAKAGFYYLNQSDHVECAWCKVLMGHWEKNDNPFEDHRLYSPSCPRVQMGPLLEITNQNAEELPQRPKYSCLETRLRSFSDWPIPDVQPAEPLAQAGLYYKKINDQVHCFHCEIKLSSWQKEDEPLQAHASWSPKCEYVLLVKGPSYVRQVLESGTTVPQFPTSMESAFTASPACEALARGIEASVLRNTITRKFFSSGCGFDTLDDLLHAISDDTGSVVALEITEPVSCSSTSSSSTVPTAPVDCS